MARPSRHSEEMIRENVARGYWSDVAIADFWDRNALERGDEEAIVDSKTRLTWGQAKRWIDRLALSLMELGLKKGEVLVVQLPNSVELCLLRLACEKTNIICLPVQWNLRDREMEYILRFTDAAAVVIPWEFRNFDYFQMVSKLRPSLPSLRYVLVTGERVPPGAVSAREMVETSLEDRYPPDHLESTKCPGTEFCLVFHTSGTTGFPKLVEYPVCPRVLSNRAFIESMKLAAKDIFGCFSAASVGPNALAYFTAPELGAKTVWMERFDPEEAFQLIERERITVGLVVPTVLARMLTHPGLGKYDLSSVRLWWCVGSLLPYQVAVEVEERLGGKILSGIGATDCGGFTIHSIDAPRAERLLTLGKPPPGIVEVKLVDDFGKEVPRGEIGEIWMRGPACVSGYYKDPETTGQVWTEDGWFKLGDLGKWDEEGNLLLMGRKKDVIIRAGQNIFPNEIENLLQTHNKVEAAAIIGIPDAVLGEKACAVVVPKPSQVFTCEEMIRFLKSKSMAAYKLPELLVIVETLPLVAEQKVDKKALAGVVLEKLRNSSNTATFRALNVAGKITS